MLVYDCSPYAGAQADGLLHNRLMAMIAAGDWGRLKLLPAGVGVPTSQRPLEQ